MSSGSCDGPKASYPIRRFAHAELFISILKEPAMPATAVRMHQVPIADVLSRIGLTHAPPTDADGLRIVHRAFLSSIPYEALAVQLGESEPLDAARLTEHMLTG